MNSPKQTESFDYIVVGAGSAGCVLARRLSENRSVNVLLIEAGPATNDFWVGTPAGMGKLFHHKRLNWRYRTEPVPTLNNRQIYWPRGKGLGGSSAINGMVYVRGNRADFDGWEALGNPGWGWDCVLPYFLRAESSWRGSGVSLGVDGPLIVSQPALRHPAADAFIEAATKCGVPRVEEFVGEEQDGTGYLPVTIADGKRQSTYVAYLQPVRRRENLKILTTTMVRRVVFEGKQACGVEVSDANGRTRIIQARREVVLSAGALNSPHLLMLSGIGDGQVLQRHSISTLVDAKGVGKNLQDHFVVRVQAQVTRDSSYNHILRGWRKYWEGLRYIATGGGYLALGSSMAAAFVKSEPSMGHADIEVSFRPMTFGYDAAGRLSVDCYAGISASVYNMRPWSRGEVTLQSARPTDAPAFLPNYLNDERDVKAMISGVRIVRRIFASNPLASRVIAEVAPGGNVASDDDIVDYMRKHGQCAFHPVGTCKMGNDPMAVVDSELRVHGVSRLRVVDASIMPTVTSGNTNAPTIMIAEKAADLIGLRPMPPR